MAGRKCGQCTTGERLYLVITLVGLLTGGGFALFGIIKDSFRTDDTSYLLIYIINSLFGVVYVINGMRYEDPYDLGILVLSVAPILIYVIADYSIGNHNTDVKEARLIAAAPFALFISGFGIALLLKFFKTKHYLSFYDVRTPELKEYLRTMLLYYFLLGVNLQIDLSAAVLTLTSGYSFDFKTGALQHNLAFFVFVSSMLVASVTYLIGYYAARRESKGLVKLYVIFSVVLVGAGLYLMIMSVDDLHKTDGYRTLSIVEILISSLVIFVRLISLTCCYLTYKNFGKGLKEQVSGTSPEEKRLLQLTVEKPDMSGFSTVHATQARISELHAFEK